MIPPKDPSTGDFGYIASSDMIARVMEDYFNTHEFKRKVSIVDLKPSNDGYVFIVEYVRETKTVSPYDRPTVDPLVVSLANDIQNDLVRKEQLDLSLKEHTTHG